MKVALAFFGQPRFVDTPKVINTYKQTILNRYDTDVFCHTWWTEDGGEYDYSSWSKISRCPIPKDALDVIDRNYKPVVLEYDAPETFVLPPKAKSFIDAKFTGKHPQGNHWNEKNYSNVMSQLRSIQTSPEAFKMGSFLRRFNLSDLAPCTMDAACVRQKL